MKHFFIILGISFALSVNAQVTINPSAVDVCQEDSVIFVVSATGYDTDTLNFAWLQNGVGFGAPNNDTITVAPNVGSWNYTVNVTTPGGQFVGTGFVTLTVNENPTATANNTGPYCVGDTISLTASGGVSYSWSGPNGFSSSLQNPTITQASLAANGTYILVATNSFGCSDTTTTQVVVNPLPTPTITVSPNDTVCLGTTVALFATGGVNYSWSMGGSGPSTTWTPTTIGNVVPSVFVTDANGCSALEFLPMVVNPTPAVTAVATPATCFGDSTGSVSVNAIGGAPFSYLWSTGDTTQTVNGLPAGSYSILVTNNFGCSTTATAVVNQPLAAVTVDSLSITNASCNGTSDGSITVHASGGVGFYNYSWIDGGVGNPRTNLPAGIYTITVTDGNGCIATVSAVVTQPNQLNATAVGSSLACFGNTNGIGSVAVSGGTPPYSYLWSNGDVTQSISGLAAGNYTVIVTDANGCTATASAAVTQPNELVATVLNQTNVVCFDNNNGTIELTATGGTQPYSPLVQWSDGFVGGPIRTGLAPGTYTATITDANGCSASVTTTINGPTSPITVQWYAVQHPCEGANNGGITVNAFGGTPPYTFIWENEDLEGQILTGLGPGNYIVTVIDANGCVAGPFGQTLIANQGIVITTPSVVNYCVGSGETIQAIVSGGTQSYGYQWIAPNGVLYSTAQAIEPTMSGIWTLIVVDGLNCTAQTYITVNLVTCDPTSVGEQLEKQIKLFPNPVSSGGNVVITLPSTHNNDVTIHLMDITGKILFQERASQEIHQLNTSGMAAGTYIVQIASHDQFIAKKLVVQ